MRLTKQIIYGIIFIIILGLLVWWIYSLIYNPTPTCNDGSRNQGETDIDCGGPCQSCEINKLKQPQVISKKVFKVLDGFGYVFEVLNPNGEWAVSSVDYDVFLKDSFGKNIYTYSKNTFIYSGELKYIVEPYQKGNFKEIASIDVQFKTPEWKEKGVFEKPSVDVQNIRTEKNNDLLTVTGKLVNPLSVSYDDPRIVGIVFNKDDAVIGASQTELDVIKNLESRDFTITFSKELSIYTQNFSPNMQFSKKLKQGDTGDEVTKLQQLLIELGIMKRDPTGFYDETTVDAVKSMQESFLVDHSNGEFDDVTIQFINSMLRGQVKQPTQQELDTGVDTSRTKVFVEIKR